VQTIEESSISPSVLASIVGGGFSNVRVNIRIVLCLEQRYFAETLVIDCCER